MNYIGRKIYYDKLTGNILLDTGEMMGDVRETIIEEDFQAYKVLSERNPQTVGVIQLQYGQYAQDFIECNGYRVNLDTLELEFNYQNADNQETQEQVYQKSLSEKVKELEEKQELLQQALDDLILNGGAL